MNFPTLDFLIRKIKEREFQNCSCRYLPYFYIYPKDALPPLLDDMDHGVIWFSLKTDYLFALPSVIESEASEVNAIIQNLIGKPLKIVILCASKNTGDEAFIEGMKKVNPDYVGPYEDGEFDGMEAEVILYLSHYNEQFSIAGMTRAEFTCPLTRP